LTDPATVRRKLGLLDWLMPSIADVLFLRFFFVALRNGAKLLGDGDTGWHIVTGQNILNTFRIPYADPYSHTMPGSPWTSHEWLADVILAAFHRLMGLNGVVLLSAVLIALTFFFLFRFLVYRKVSAVTAAFFTIIAAWASTLHWLARPHVFSFLLTLAFIVILELYQREKVNYLKFLPLLMLFWVNLHGGYIIGLILIFLYAGGNLLIFLTAQEKREEAKKNFKALGIFAVLSTVAAFVNPHGPAILYFPFHNVGQEYLMDVISEWQSPNFHKYVIFEFMLLVFIVTFVLSKRKPDVFEGGVALLLTHMSLYSARFIPLFAIILSPLAAVRAGKVLDQLTEYMAELRIVRETRNISRKISENVTTLEKRFDRHLWIYVAVLVSIMIGLNGGKLGNALLIESTHDKNEFPVDALEFAMTNGISGNMFNNDLWGGYIIYKSYPRYRVFMDGRSDMYAAPFVKEYVKVIKADLDYENILDKYNVTWVMFNANFPICQLLAATGKWKLVYADTTANILLKDIPENRELIEKYKGTMFIPKDEKN
jgi:hypothetical protein